MLSHINERARRATAFLRNRGVGTFFREIHHRLVERHYERRLGIDTASRIKLSDIGVDRPDSRDSMPIGYAAFYSALRKVPMELSDSVFLDYGVGTGRAVCAAATFPFRRVIGIDISATLIDLAQANLDRLRYRRAKHVELELIDATQYDVPPDVNLIYFFNPFAGDTLRKVLGKMSSSFQLHPRKMYIVFFNNDHFERIIVEEEKWLAKIQQTEFYPHISCGVYETRMD